MASPLSPENLDLSALIDGIYAAALGEADWEMPLQQMRGLVGSRSSHLLAFDRRSQLPAVNVVAADDANWAAAMGKAYSGVFGAHDPSFPIMADWDVGRWCDDHELGLPRQHANQFYYQEFMRAYGLGSMAGLFVLRDVSGNIALSFCGELGATGFSADQRRIIDAIHPHVSRAMRMQQRLGQLEANVAIAGGALNGLEMPVFILNQDRRLVWANVVADALMAREPALRFAQGVLMLEQAAWLAACAKGGLLLRKKSGAALPLALVPIPEQSRLSRMDPGRLWLMTHAALRTPGARVKRLRLFYGFTEAEAELAVLMACEGMSAQECADARGVSVSTVRTQFKEIYIKAGIQRAGQLVGLVLAV